MRHIIKTILISLLVSLLFGGVFALAEESVPTHQLIINEVARGSEINPERDCWFELYNPTDEEIFLKDWKVSGVTSGGRFIDITTEDVIAIQPKNYFLVSHYTDSSSSALDTDPQVNKTSILFPEADIHIILKDPEGNISDEIQTHVEPEEMEIVGEYEETETVTLYRSQERNWPIGDGLSEDEWQPAVMRKNLKEETTKTFATPFYDNSRFQKIGEVKDFDYSIFTGEDAYPRMEIYWQNPTSDHLTSLHLYQINEDGDGWELIEIFNPIIPETGEDAYPRLEPEFPNEYTLENFDPLIHAAFKMTTVDAFNRESEGEEIWIDANPKILINEILPNPKTRETENEFIEIWNAGKVAVNLWGWELDDEKLDDDKSYFFMNEERDYYLEPGEFLVFERWETGITLGNTGDGVNLFDADWNWVDDYFFAPDLEGRSWGRNPDDLDEWISFNHPTPGAANIEVNHSPVVIVHEQGGTGYMNINLTGEDSYDPDDDDLTFLWTYEEGVTDDRKNPTAYTYTTPGEKIITLVVTDEFGLSDTYTNFFTATEKPSSSKQTEIKLSYPTYSLINEFLPNPEGNDSENEWIELFNNTNSTIDLSGWYLDDAEGGSSPYKIPEGIKIASGQYLLFSAPEVNLSFKNSEDQVRLLDPNKEAKQTITYSDCAEDMSYAKKEDGSWEWNSRLTPGNKNDFPPPPKAYKVGSVIIDSVLANPEGSDTGNEKIILKNMTGEEINLEGWTLEDGGSHETVLRTTHSVRRTLMLNQEDFKFTLNNSSEKLTLKDPVGNTIDTFKWYSAPSGSWLINQNILYDGMTATVTRTIDGDTFVMEIDGRKLTTRLLGVDTPETVHPKKEVEFFGKEASNFMKKTLTGKTITLKFNTLQKSKVDLYGRVLVYAYLDDVMINSELIKKGLGYAYTRFPFDYSEEFLEYEKQAKENKIGMWADEKTREIMEEEIEEKMEGEIEESRPCENDDECEPEILLLEEIEPIPVETRDLASLGLNTLQIHSLLPNPEKGNEEYIKIENTGTEIINLEGWKLDDNLEGGSKPFTFPKIEIQPNEILFLYKSQTKIALNNSNDCATLMTPNNEIIDQICYQKTHAGEVFTHDGGDSPDKKTTTQKSQPAKKHTFSRPAEFYQWELVNNEITGLIKSINEETKEIMIGDEMVSYKNGNIDMETVKQMIDFSLPITLKTRSSKNHHELIGIQLSDENSLPDSHTNVHSNLFIFNLLSLMISGGGLVFLRKMKM